MSGRGRGRGRKKCAKTEALPAAVEAANHNHATMLATPLGALMRIEATLWMNARGGGRISIDDFYTSARAHEWLGLNHNGGRVDEKKMSAPKMVPKDLSKLSNDAYELISQLSEEELLLFDFSAVSTWNPKDIPNLYPLYRLYASSKGKIQLEILQQPQQPKGGGANSATSKSNIKISTRSEVLGNMYHHSRKYFSFGSTASNPCALYNWWKHAMGVAQMILDHRESMTATKTSNGKAGSSEGNASFKSFMTNNHSDSVAEASNKSPTKPNGGEMKKTTLEERVRARSLLNPANIAKAKQQASKKVGGETSPQDRENKSLLELADSLRSYSQRRGVVSSAGGAGGSALDRLKNRGASCGGVSGTHATKNIARLPVMDVIKDARSTWNSVVNESTDQQDNSGGIKSSRVAGARPMVNIDLSRVLFHLRMNMVSATNDNITTDSKRQMELQLLGLLEKLAALVPTWIHLRRAPSTLTGTITRRSGNGVSTSTKQKDATATTSNNKLNIRHSIIVIRNDSVDYAGDVRAKLGGRVLIKGAGGSKTAGAAKPKGSKRSLQDMERQQQPHKAVQGPVGVADAIVPPSFQRMYGKALGLDKKNGK